MKKKIVIGLVSIIGLAFITLYITSKPPLILTKATQDGEDLLIEHDGNAHFMI